MGIQMLNFILNFHKSSSTHTEKQDLLNTRHFVTWDDTGVTILFSKCGMLWCSQSNKMQQSNKEKNCFNNTSSGGQLTTQRTFVFTQGGFWNYLWAPLREKRPEQGFCCLYSILWARQQKAERERLIAGLECKADWVSKVFLLRQTVQKCFLPQPQKGKRNSFQSSSTISCTQSCCPGKLCCLQPWQLSKSNWIKPQVTWSYLIADSALSRMSYRRPQLELSDDTECSWTITVPRQEYGIFL